MNLIALALRKPILINLLTVFLVAFGIFKASQMSRDAFPSIHFDTVTITTTYPGASTEEVERFVTRVIEEAIENIEGIEDFESNSTEAFSLVIAKLDPDLSRVKKNKTITDIQRAVDSIRDLPEQILDRPLVNEIEGAVFGVITVALGGEVDYADLHLAADQLRDRLLAMPGVKNLQEYGVREAEYSIEVKPDLLAKYNMNLLQVISVLKNNHINLPGGTMKTDQGDLLVRTVGEAESIDDIKQMILRSNVSGKMVRIEDVADVRKAYPETKRLYRANGSRSIHFIVIKKNAGDIIEIAEQSRIVGQKFAEDYPNKDLKVSFINDYSQFVENRLNVLTSNSYMGIVLVLVVLLFFLSFDIALVTAIGMPVAFCAAFIVLAYMHVSINLISMFGLVIVLGMLVDDAIIVAENIWQHFEMGKPPKQAVLDGTMEVFWPVCATILTTMAAFSPLFLVSGIFGKFLTDIPLGVIVCLVMSLMEAMLILPTHAYDLLKLRVRMFGHPFLKRVHKQGEPSSNDSSAGQAKQEVKQGAEQESKHSQDTTSPLKTSTRSTPPPVQAKGWIMYAYERLLRTCVRWRYLVSGLLATAVAGSMMFAIQHIPFILFPSSGVEVIDMRVDWPKGLLKEQTEQRMLEVERVVEGLTREELRDYITKVGVQENNNLDPLRKRGAHLGQVNIYLTPENARERSAEEIISALRPKVEEVAMPLGAQRVSFHRLRTGPPVGKPVAIKVRGQDLMQADLAADQLIAALKQESGVIDISKDFQAGKKELIVEVDEAAAAKAQVDVRQVASHIRTLIEGTEAGFFQDGEERIPIKVRFPESNRNNLEDLKSSLIANAFGQLLPLERVISVRQGVGIEEMKRFDGERAITVSADIKEQETTASQVGQRILPTLASLRQDFPALSFEQGGEYQDTQESVGSLKEAGLVAVAVIFLILATQFNSLTQPFVIMLAIPFGALGVIWSFYVYGLPLSFMGCIGLIGLSGVVVNDSIVLVDFINQAKKRGLSSFEACVHAGLRRFRAVWLTTLTTSFGLIPLVYGWGGDDKFLKPAATALAFGLLFATMQILLFVPAFYLIREDLERGLVWLARGTKNMLIPRSWRPKPSQVLEEQDAS